jgi:hypothetical protein
MSTWKAKFEKKQQDQKDAEMAKKVAVNDISFPSLSTESAWGSAGAGAGAGKAKETPASKKSFAAMAAEWKDKEETEKNRKAMDIERSTMGLKQNSEFSRRGGFLYNFGQTHSRMEDTYYEDEYADDYVPPPTADTSDDWRVAERKVRRAPKTAAERAMETNNDEEDAPPSFWNEHQDESVWSKY